MFCVDESILNSPPELNCALQFEQQPHEISQIRLGVRPAKAAMTGLYLEVSDHLLGMIQQQNLDVMLDSMANQYPAPQELIQLSLNLLRLRSSLAVL